MIVKTAYNLGGLVILLYLWPVTMTSLYRTNDINYNNKNNVDVIKVICENIFIFAWLSSFSPNRSGNVIKLWFLGHITGHQQHYYILSCTGSIWAVILYWLDTFLLYTVTDLNIAFLVPDSCWATERNSNSMHADVTDDVFENV
jgi:hypothetical protein